MSIILFLTTKIKYSQGGSTLLRRYNGNFQKALAGVFPNKGKLMQFNLIFFFANVKIRTCLNEKKKN